MSGSEENWDLDGPTTTNGSTQKYQFNNNNSNNNSFRCQSKNITEYETFNEKRGVERRNFHRGQFQETLNISSSSIGLIIGRAGSNIKRTQENYRVHLDIDRQENVLTISGEVKNDVHNALKYIKDQIENSNSNQRQNGNSRPSSRGGGGGGGGGRGRNNYNHNYNSNDDYENHIEREETPRQGNYYSPPDEKKYKEPEEEEQPIMIDWDAANRRSEIESVKRWAKCPKLTKNFYQEHQEVANLTEEEIATIRANNNNITVSRVFEESEKNISGGDDIPNPIWKFEHCFEQYPDLLEEIKKQGFTNPSPIQAQAWPVLLKGEDLIGIAQTGTGKTLAFLLPAMIHTEYQSIPRSERNGPNVLVMAPTRELALQIEKEVNKYSFRGMKAVCVYGGGSRKDQINHVQEGAEIIICTPGRLNDLIQANVIDVSTITYLVLDEADRMLDMGFEPQIRKILLDIRPDRQTVMTSATWPPGVRRLAQSYMDNPIQICVGTLDLAATHTVTQIVEIMEDEEKYMRVKDFIRNMSPDDKIIIFCGRKTRADDLSSDLTLDGEMCQCIHGSRDQADREQAISDISSGFVKILIATDVASRGLDIEDITHVINFDFPRNIEEYVHRVGRTGRAGRNGVSISYLTRTDWGMAQQLIDILKEANQEIPDELFQMADRFQAMKDRRANEMEKIGGFRGSRGRGGGCGDRGGGDRFGGGSGGGGDRFNKGGRGGNGGGGFQRRF